MTLKLNGTTTLGDWRWLVAAACCAAVGGAGGGRGRRYYGRGSSTRIAPTSNSSIVVVVRWDVRSGRRETLVNSTPGRLSLTPGGVDVNGNDVVQEAAL